MGSYPNGAGGGVKMMKPKRGQAIIMDGGRMIHGVERTHPGHISKPLIKGCVAEYIIKYFTTLHFSNNI